MSPSEILRFWATYTRTRWFTPGGNSSPPGKYLDVHHLARFAAGNAQGGVPHFPGLFPEDGTEQALLGRQLGLPLGRNLPHQNVPGPHLGPHANDAALIQISQRFFAQLRNVSGYFFGAEPDVAGLAFVLFHVDGRKVVLLHQPLADQYGVLAVVTLPQREGYQNVAAEGELTTFHAGSVGKDLSLSDHLSGNNNRPLIEAHALIGPLELSQPVNLAPPVLAPDNDLVGGDTLHHAILSGYNEPAGIARYATFNAAPDKRYLRAEEWYCSTLRLGAHERSDCVVVLEKRDEGGGHAEDLGAPQEPPEIWHSCCPGGPSRIISNKKRLNKARCNPLLPRQPYPRHPACGPPLAAPGGRANGKGRAFLPRAST